MEKTLLFFALFMPCLLSAQEIKGEIQNAKPSKRFEYMSYSLQTNKLTLSIDEGFLANEKGKARGFKNSIEMMSFFGKDGWELVLVLVPEGFDPTAKASRPPIDSYFKKDVAGWTDEEVKDFLSKYKLTNISLF
jgi:hypothetical protein